MLALNERGEDFDALGELVEAAKVTRSPTGCFSLDGAPAWIRYAAEGRARGKVVITV